MVMEHASSYGAGAPFAADAMRVTIRDALSDAISGIVDRDMFLHRVAHLISESSGHPLIAVYTRPVTGGALSLRASTLPPTVSAPPRVVLAAADGDAHATAVLEFTEGRNAALVVPIHDDGDTFGALVAFSSGHSFSDSDRAVLSAMVEEVAPVISVAERHHAVKQFSVIDLATGAYAGWYVTQRLEEEIARAQRTGDAVTIILIDVVDFEIIQHALGYDAAEGLLRDIAAELSGATRIFDVVARRAASEFAILLPDSDAIDAMTIVDRVRTRVGRVIEKLESKSRLAGRIQMATGVASFPADGDRASALMLTADHRLDDDSTRMRRVDGGA